MTTAGVHATIYEMGAPVGHALIIGPDVPRIHHSDGLPVYLVVEHDEGTPIVYQNGVTKNLLAYPSSWARPARHEWSRVLLAKHERLPFIAPIPLHDRGVD